MALGSTGVVFFFVRGVKPITCMLAKECVELYLLFSIYLHA
jgi:hypothetical protein